MAMLRIFLLLFLCILPAALSCDDQSINELKDILFNGDGGIGAVCGVSALPCSIDKTKRCSAKCQGKYSNLTKLCVDCFYSPVSNDLCKKDLLSTLFMCLDGLNLECNGGLSYPTQSIAVPSKSDKSSVELLNYIVLPWVNLALVVLVWLYVIRKTTNSRGSRSRQDWKRKKNDSANSDESDEENLSTSRNQRNDVTGEIQEEQGDTPAAPNMQIYVDKMKSSKSLSSFRKSDNDSGSELGETRTSARAKNEIGAARSEENNGNSFGLPFLKRAFKQDGSEDKRDVEASFSFNTNQDPSPSTASGMRPPEAIHDVRPSSSLLNSIEPATPAMTTPGGSVFAKMMSNMSMEQRSQFSAMMNMSQEQMSVLPESMRKQVSMLQNFNKQPAAAQSGGPEESTLMSPRDIFPKVGPSPG
ncbi:hypothetical protein GUITHDRAFT_117439 [Guillardia theta CCMP2712]|uniref:Uncharacterized protein n=1 Tax=Guillardia theta (strain CCMP2712) TaxID=905079 RepID=L1IJM8_GUITC|nr:hypothetical protein GUITHDRAFT_117439 [Guillardia theta CCMP2712]EKX36441.1 hypothetical protein GUITHDRAFT_117439 [Guillardia theta CCMP2712]|eukprot:XP_005823421.1 hypothetical protein GUITHDRAFT_117439 [Guillardia theta CCMP2712]